MNSWHIKQAVRTLNLGGVIAYPTEAVWGLGCDPWNRVAVERLLHLKNRPVDKGLILVAADIAQLGSLVHEIPQSKYSLLEQSWPGSTTWLIPDDCHVIPRWIKGLHGSVAVRVSAHSGVRRLCQAFGGMLVSTSANRAGEVPARSQREVRSAFSHTLDYVLPGQTGGRSRPSEIRSLSDGAVLRNG